MARRLKAAAVAIVCVLASGCWIEDNAVRERDSLRLFRYEGMLGGCEMQTGWMAEVTADDTLTPGTDGHWERLKYLECLQHLHSGRRAPRGYETGGDDD